MKIHSLFAEILIFFLILLFFIIPPICNTIGSTAEKVAFINWTFPAVQFILALSALLIFIVYKNNKEKKINIFGFRILFTIGLLFASSLFMNFLSIVLPWDFLKTNVEITLPKNLLEWFFCILNFIFSAFYEEVIYRFYFADGIISILTQINQFFDKKIFKIISEILGCVVFALAHSYMGILAVLNAAIAHFILRYTYKKSNSIIPGVISHFTYNIISLILL